MLSKFKYGVLNGVQLSEKTSAGWEELQPDRNGSVSNNIALKKPQKMIHECDFRRMITNPY